MNRSLLAILLLFPSTVGAATPPASAPDQPTMEQKEAREYYSRGHRLLKAGDLNSAHFYLERAAILSPQDPQILNDMGLTCESLGQDERAETYYLKAIEADYKYLPAYSNLGFLYERRGDAFNAVRYFQTRVDLGKGRDRWTLEAQAELEKLLRSSPSLRLKKQEADRKALENAMALRARQRASRSRQEKGVDAELDYQRGMTYYQGRFYDAAQASFEKCLTLDPGHAGARHMLKRLEALHESRPAPSRKMSDADIARLNAMKEYDRGLRLLRQGRQAEALQAFNRALGYAPSDPDIMAARIKASGQ